MVRVEELGARAPFLLKEEVPAKGLVVRLAGQPFKLASQFRKEDGSYKVQLVCPVTVRGNDGERLSYSFAPPPSAMTTIAREWGSETDEWPKGGKLRVTTEKMTQGPAKGKRTFVVEVVEPLVKRPSSGSKSSGKPSGKPKPGEAASEEEEEEASEDASEEESEEEDAEEETEEE